MIKFIHGGTMVTFSQTTPGDLVEYNSRDGRIIAIVLSNEGAPLLGTLTPTDEPHPRLWQDYNEAVCISYGASWALEPHHNKRDTTERNEGPRAGLLALTPTGWLMNFADSPIGVHGRFTSVWWDLRAFSEVRRLPSNAIVYGSWSIWTSVEERARLGSAPFLSYAAQPPKSLS